ncbi:HNH endonuclease [Zunongwangia profunda]
MSNGIALSPTLHRAFDRELIYITVDYKVKVCAVVNYIDSKLYLNPV